MKRGICDFFLVFVPFRKLYVYLVQKQPVLPSLNLVSVGKQLRQFEAWFGCIERPLAENIYIYPFKEAQ